MKTAKESRRKTREELFGRPTAALLEMTDDDEDNQQEDPEDEVF